MDGLIYSTDGRIGGSTTRNTQELNERLEEWEMEDALEEHLGRDETMTWIDMVKRRQQN